MSNDTECEGPHVLTHFGKRLPTGRHQKRIYCPGSGNGLRDISLFSNGKNWQDRKGYRD